MFFISDIGFIGLPNFLLTNHYFSIFIIHYDCNSSKLLKYMRLLIKSCVDFLGSVII